MFGHNNVVFKIFDDNERFVISFVGNRDMILDGARHGAKLTQNKLNEPMLIIGENGMTIESSSGMLHINICLYKNWKLVQKV